MVMAGPGGCPSAVGESRPTGCLHPMRPLIKRASWCGLVGLETRCSRWTDSSGVDRESEPAAIARELPQPVGSTGRRTRSLPYTGNNQHHP